MPRFSLVLGLACALTAGAHADGERSTAIRIEPKDTDAAKRAVALTKALRAVATKPHAKPSPAATDAAIAQADCAVLQPACAAAVGGKLAVTHMLVGQLERRGGRYALTLSLINVDTKKRVRSLRDVSGVNADLQRWAKTLYARMLDEGTGEIVLVANARRGQVLVDGLVVTELYDGHATISDVALGSHEIQIRAAGYRPFTTELEVDGRTEQNVLLDPQ